MVSLWVSMPIKHTTLLELLSRPVTGDISDIHDKEGKIIQPILEKKHLESSNLSDTTEATPEEIKA